MKGKKYRVSFRGDEYVLKLIIEMVYNSEYLKATELYS